MHSIRTLATVIAAISLLGCRIPNGYEEFYQPETILKNSPRNSVIVRTFDDEESLKSAYAAERDRGAVYVGKSSFEGIYVDPQRSTRKASAIGANLVLVAINYSHTEEGFRTVTDYQGGETTRYESYSSGTVGGFGNQTKYSGKTTTYATSPTYTTTRSVPYSHKRYSHLAVFLKTVKPPAPSEAF